MEILPSLLGFISSRVKVLKSNISDLVNDPAEASQNLTYKMLQDLNAGVYAMAGTTPEASKEMGKKFGKAKQNGAPMPPLNIGDMASKSTLGAGTMLGKGAKLFNFQKEATALKMKDAGFPTEEIRRRTDTWLGHPDGNPRQEIPDHNMAFDPAHFLVDPQAERYMPSVMVKTTKDGAKLGDIIKHPGLFAAYPELKNVEAIIGTGTKVRGGEFDPGANTIMAYGRTDEEVLSILLHEIQHAVQRKEGWNPGSSMEFVPHDPRTKRIYESRAKGTDPKTEEKVRYELYQKTGGEMDARMAQARQYFDEHLLKTVDPALSYKEYPIEEMLLWKNSKP